MILGWVNIPAPSIASVECRDRHGPPPRIRHDGGAVIRYAAPVLFEKIIEIRDETPHSAPLNMALDEVLLGDICEPLLRIYRWEGAAVSFGYFGRYAPVAAAWPGRALVRRMTGGGVVPHGSDLTYSLIVPAGHAFAETSVPAGFNQRRTSWRARNE